MARRVKVRCGWVAVALLAAGLAASDAQAQCWGDGAKAEGYANPGLLTAPQELADHLADPGVQILDARAADRYAAGHIPGAVGLPVPEITRTINGVPGMLASVGEVERVLGGRGVTRDSRLIVYDEFGGIEATRLFWTLEFLGHPQVSVLQGGFELWRQEGRPVAQESPRPTAAEYTAAPVPAMSVDLAWVKSRLGSREVVLVDARSPEEFDGEIAGRDVARPGHIPGAVNVDWVRNLTPTEPRQFKAGPDLARLYRRAGVTPDREVVVYCRTGVRASHAYFALRLLGYPRVRLYDGSYVEWAADPSLPVTR